MANKANVTSLEIHDKADSVAALLPNRWVVGGQTQACIYDERDSHARVLWAPSGAVKWSPSGVAANKAVIAVVNNETVENGGGVYLYSHDRIFQQMLYKCKSPSQITLTSKGFVILFQPHTLHVFRHKLVRFNPISTSFIATPDITATYINSDGGYVDIHYVTCIPGHDHVVFSYFSGVTCFTADLSSPIWTVVCDWWGGPANILSQPEGLCADSSRVYIVDTRLQAVVVLSAASGGHLRTFQIPAVSQNLKGLALGDGTLCAVDCSAMKIRTFRDPAEDEHVRYQRDTFQNSDQTSMATESNRLHDKNNLDRIRELEALYSDQASMAAESNRLHDKDNLDIQNIYIRSKDPTPEDEHVRYERDAFQNSDQTSMAAESNRLHDKNNQDRIRELEGIIRKLQSVLWNKVMIRVACKIGIKWKFLLRGLLKGNKDVESHITRIEHNYKEDLMEQGYQCMVTWCNMAGEDAVIDDVIKTLEGYTVDRKDLADEIRREVSMNARE